MTKTIKQGLSLLPVALISVVLPYSQAGAACTPSGFAVSDGGTVTCTGDTTNQNRFNGYRTPRNNLAINVESGATVTGDRDGFQLLGTAPNLRNEGTITGTSDVGVVSWGGGSVINEAGSAITGGLHGVWMPRDSGIVTNVGRITGSTGMGVLFGNGGSVTNEDSGEITGNIDGIRIGGTSGSVNNAGKVIGTTDTGVELSSGGSVTNAAGGSITGVNGVGFGGGVTNALINRGAITGVNSAVRATASAGAVSIDNYDTIDGAIVLAQPLDNRITNHAGATLTGNITAGAGADTFTNHGTYSGNADLGDGDNVVTNTSRNSFTANLTAGAGADTFTNHGTYTGDVDLGDGDNVVINTSRNSFAGNLTAGAGADTFTNHGTYTGNADLGDGNNVVTNTSHNSFTGNLTAGAGDDTVDNSGTFTGNVDLDGGANAFNNLAGGLFNAGTIVNVGAGNTLSNAGTLSPGGGGAIQTTNIGGNYVQSATGSYTLDLDMVSAQADLVSVSGSAALAGTLVINPLNVVANQREVTVLSAAGGVSDNGLVLLNPTAVDYILSYPNPNDVVLAFTIDFAPYQVGLDNNQRAVGENLNAILGAGGGTLGPVLDELAAVIDLDTYRGALDRLHGAHYQSQLGATLLAAQHLFAKRLLTCPGSVQDRAAESGDERCLWGQVIGRDLQVERSDENLGGEEQVWGFAGGYEGPLPLGQDLRGALAVAIEDSDVQSANGASGEGVRLSLGASLEKRWDALKARLGVYGGTVTYDSERAIGLGGVGTARADQDIHYAGLIGRLSYDLRAGRVRLVPMLDLAATYLRYGDLRERGAGAASLIVADEAQWVYSATPGVEASTALIDNAERRLDAYVHAGVSFYADNDYRLRTRFVGAPVQTPGFTTVADNDDVVGNLSVGLELVAANGLSLQLGYDGHYSDNIESHGGHLRLAMPF